MLIQRYCLLFDGTHIGAGIQLRKPSTSRWNSTVWIAYKFIIRRRYSRVYNAYCIWFKSIIPEKYCCFYTTTATITTTIQLRLQTIIASILAVQINLFNEIFLSILGFNRRRSWKADGGNVAGVRGNWYLNWYCGRWCELMLTLILSDVRFKFESFCLQETYSQTMYVCMYVRLY